MNSMKKPVPPVIKRNRLYDFSQTLISQTLGASKNPPLAALSAIRIVI